MPEPKKLERLVVEMEKYLVMHPKGKFEVIDGKKYEDTLSMLQKNVGGFIDLLYLGEELAERDIDAYVNDEGKLIGLEPNFVRQFVKKDGDSLYDIVQGNVVFSKVDQSDGKTYPLDDDDIEFIKNYMGTNIYTLVNNYGLISVVRI